MSEYNINEVERNEQAQEQGNILGAVVCGAIAAFGAAIVLALISIACKIQWSWMAIGAGVVVGFAVRLYAKRESISYGIVAGIFALIVCVMGDFLTNTGFIAEEVSMSYFDTLTSIIPSHYGEIAFIDFDFLSLLFYGIAAYVAFCIGKKTVEEKDQE